MPVADDQVVGIGGGEKEEQGEKGHRRSINASPRFARLGTVENLNCWGGKSSPQKQATLERVAAARIGRPTGRAFITLGDPQGRTDRPGGLPYQENAVL